MTEPADIEVEAAQRPAAFWARNHGVTTDLTVLGAVIYLTDQIVISGEAHGFIATFGLVYTATYCLEAFSSRIKSPLPFGNGLVTLLGRVREALDTTRSVLMRLSAVGFGAFIALKMCGFSVEVSKAHLVLLSGIALAVYLIIHTARSGYSGVRKTLQFTSAFLLFYELHLLAKVIWIDFP